MPLTAQQKRKFRSIGHQLKPVILVGDKGISEAIVSETQRALTDHELIKVSIRQSDREARSALSEQLCSECKAELVQKIGNISLIYKAAEKPNPKLSNLLRTMI